MRSNALTGRGERRSSPWRAGWCAWAAITLLVSISPGLARADVRAGTTAAFPAVVALGETGVRASISLSNENTGLSTLFTNVVCNAGDLKSGCSSTQRGIVLVPSCTTITAGLCAPGAADPGVFAVSSIGVGRRGSTCSGDAFQIAPADAAGTLIVRPLPLGRHVVLPGWLARCVIDFTFDVLRMPAADAEPNAPGIQTAQATSHMQRSIFGSDAARDTDVTTVRRAVPSISTVASPDIVLGAGSLSDRATVSGRVSAVAGASVDFRLYGPDDADCTGPAVFESLDVPYPVGRWGCGVGLVYADAGRHVSLGRDLQR